MVRKNEGGRGRPCCRVAEISPNSSSRKAAVKQGSKVHTPSFGTVSFASNLHISSPHSSLPTPPFLRICWSS